MKNNIITNSKKSKKFLLIFGIIAVIGLLFLVLIYFSGSSLPTNYILYKIVDDFDDIVETLFELALTVAVIVFLIVFFKKIWHKLWFIIYFKLNFKTKD